MRWLLERVDRDLDRRRPGARKGSAAGTGDSAQALKEEMSP